MLLGCFGSFGSLLNSWVLLLGPYTPHPAVLPFSWPSGFLVGGINDPYVYIHCCGWNLRGWM